MSSVEGYSIAENEDIYPEPVPSESTPVKDTSESQFIQSMEMNGPIDGMLKEAIRDPQLEFEFIYGDVYYPDKKPLTKERFLKVKQQLTSDTKYINLEETSELDIRCELRHRGKSVMSNIRATVEGLSEIKQYCIQDNFDDLNPYFIKKQKYKHPKFPSENYSVASSGLYPMRTTLKDEILLTYNKHQSRKYSRKQSNETKFVTHHEVEDYLKDWSSKNKYFRFKKRYSFLTSNQMWRIDLTAVKSSPRGKHLNQFTYSKSFKESGLLSQPETFELEIEYVGSAASSNPPIQTFVNSKDLFDIDESDTQYPQQMSLFTSSEAMVSQDEVNESIQPSSPRYTEGIEFDVPLEELQSPRNILPESITIRPSYWVDSEQEEVYSIVKNGYEPEEWVHKSYEFKPLYDDKRSQQYQIEIIPEVEVTTKENKTYTVSKIFVPYEYVVEQSTLNLPSYIDTSEEGFTPKDPLFANKLTIVSSKEWSDTETNKEIIQTIESSDKSVEYYLDTYEIENKVAVVVLKPTFQWTNKFNQVIEISTLRIPSKYIEELRDPYESDDNPKRFKLSSDYAKATVVERLLSQLDDIIHELYTCICGTQFYLDSLEESEVLSNYIQLTDPHSIYHKQGWKFVGPQPVSMAQTHINPYNSQSILSGYVVTEKADGIRAQLMIYETNGYLITTKKEIIHTGMIFQTPSNWIFDGEYITQDKHGNPIQLFMIFDVYFSDEYSEQPYTYPWIVTPNTKRPKVSKQDKEEGPQSGWKPEPLQEVTKSTPMSRSEIIDVFKTEVEIQPTLDDRTSLIRIGFKDYLQGPEVLKKKRGEFTNIQGIFKASKKILDKPGGFEYETDGLIFLPMYTPVKGMSEGDTVKSIRGTWTLNYKWKPPEENTIDFKVVFMKDKPKPISFNYTKPDGTTELRYYQKVQLVVEYKEKDDSSINFSWSIVTNKPVNRQSYQYFDPPTHTRDNIHITKIPLERNRMKCIKDNKDITNGCIVEMRYNPNDKEGFLWTPLRVRDDKLKPQYFTIANNIWNTINEPVSPDMIRGDVDFTVFSELETPGDKYYIDTKLAEDTPIRSLHNYIKSKLISRVGSSHDHKHPLNIADLSCGRGGDNKKYTSIRNKINFLLGLDISTNVNEAAQRYHSMRQPKPKALFLQFDTSKSIETKEGCIDTLYKENPTYGQDMLSIIFGSATYPSLYKSIVKEYGGVAKHKFDMVSSQFSLHYYFKDKETLHGFCKNLNYLCSPGGYFIGTCYDGRKVFDTFQESGKDSIEMTDRFGTLVYQIKKNYSIQDFTYTEDNEEEMLGQEIDVFMSSIGQPITEYLVNFDYFIDVMKQYGFEPALPSFRKGEYNPITQPIQSFTSFIDELDTIKDRDNSFVKKTYNTDMYYVKQYKGYSQLSKLNNLFVFQKK